MMNSRATRVLTLAVLSVSSSILNLAYGEIKRWDEGTAKLALRRRRRDA